MLENDGNVRSTVLTQLSLTYSNEGWTIWKHNLALCHVPGTSSRVIRRVWNKVSNTFMLASFSLHLLSTSDLCISIIHPLQYPVAVLMFVIFRNLGL